MCPPKAVTPIDPEAVWVASSAQPPDGLLTMVVEIFPTRADPTCARILYALMNGPLCVRDLSIVGGISEYDVSHQLRFLRERRLVKTRREGTTIYDSVDDVHVAALFKEAEYHADHVRQGLPDHHTRSRFLRSGEGAACCLFGACICVSEQISGRGWRTGRPLCTLGTQLRRRHGTPACCSSGPDWPRNVRFCTRRPFTA